MKEILREAHRCFLSDLVGLCKSYEVDEIKIENDMIVAINHDSQIGGES